MNANNTVTLAEEDDQKHDKLLQMSRRLFTQPEFSDLTITCQGKTFKCHKAILSQRSEWFATCIRNGFKESRTSTIDLPEDDPWAVEIMLTYLYTLEEPKTKFTYLTTGGDFAKILTALAVAEKYQIDKLKTSVLRLTFQAFDEHLQKVGDEVSETPIMLSIDDFIYFLSYEKTLKIICDILTAIFAGPYHVRKRIEDESIAVLALYCGALQITTIKTCIENIPSISPRLTDGLAKRCKLLEKELSQR